MRVSEIKMRVSEIFWSQKLPKSAREQKYFELIRVSKNIVNLRLNSVNYLNIQIMIKLFEHFTLLLLGKYNIFAHANQQQNIFAHAHFLALFGNFWFRSRA